MDRFKNIVIVIAVSVAMISCSTARKVNEKNKLNNEFRKSTLQTMQTLLNNYGLPSLSVAVSIDSEIVFSEAIGYADFEQKLPADSRTRYSVGSIAKPMTGVALGKLIDAGEISLNADVGELVSLSASYPKISFEQLASHTAGIPHQTQEREQYEYTDISDHKSPFEVLNVFANHPLLFSPGDGFKYSSNGYILLSAAIEVASKENYVDFIKNSVWKAFDMNSTELDTSTAGLGSEAVYYSSRDGKGDFVPATKKRDRSFLFGGGGFISTPTDLVKFSRALYQENYLSEEMKKYMLTPVKLKNGENNPQNYGIGWRIGELTDYSNIDNKLLVAHHGGVTGGAATAYLYVIPDRKAAISFATNTLPDRFWEIRPALEKILVDYLRRIEEV